MADEKSPPSPDEEPTELGPIEGPTGQHVGPYRLLEKIGKGGMGEVWRAEQDSPRRQVAVKVIKRGMDTKQVIARFEVERQALALMDHPNVAQVYDAGETPGGRPYFAMELVRGEPITDYCDRSRLRTRERLELFRLVCEGVQHAHHKAIIHRDLKPSNVLVTVGDADTPVPKIIDFGVAKATNQHLTERTLFTELGQLIGTPEYMSPEQAEMTGADIDTRTDVYSLGVLLYELLVGALPFDPKELRRGGLAEIQRKIREEEPPRPSTRVSSLGDTSTRVAAQRKTDASALARRLRGDLDWIVVKALDKDRTRRYSSPSDLSLDIGRHLRHEPVVARPPGMAYLASKFVARHRPAVISAAIVVISLLGGIATTSWQAVRATRAERLAQEEAESASQVTDFLVDLFEVNEPGPDVGNTITARELLDRGAQKIDQQLAEQPLIQARLLETMGRVYQELGLYELAVPLAERALAQREDLLEGDHPHLRQSLVGVGMLKWRLAQWQEAEELFARELAIVQETSGEEHEDYAAALESLGMVFLGQQKFRQAEAAFSRVLAIREKVRGPDHSDTLDIVGNLGVLYLEEGKPGQALPFFQRVVEVRERVPATPDGFDRLGPALNNLGAAYVDLGRYVEAEPFLRRTLTIRRQTLGNEHPFTGSAHHNLGRLYGLLQRHEEGELHLQRALEIGQKAYGSEHPKMASTLLDYANLLRAQGRHQEAESRYRRSLEIGEKSLGGGHDLVLETLAEYAISLHAEGREVDAAEVEARIAGVASKSE